MNDAVPTGVFGRSIALVEGDFVLVDGDPGPDGRVPRVLALVSGRDNFAQALQVIIETPFGSDQVNVNYGLDIAAIFTVANTVPSIKDVIRLNLVKSLSADDRVREINEIVFDDEPDFAQLAPEFAGGDPGARARHGRVWHAVVKFTTIGNNQQQVIVSGASP
jgi:phage baseplate assembly protein W